MDSTTPEMEALKTRLKACCGAMRRRYASA